MRPIRQRLVVDVREACRRIRTGKAQWTYGFVSALLRQGVEVTLVSDAPLPKEWRDHKNATPMILPQKGLRWHLAVARMLKRMPGVTYVSPTSFIVPALVGGSVRCMPVVHDLIAFRGEPHDRKATLIERLTLPRALSFAAHVCTISESTKADLLARFPSLDAERVTVIYAGPMREQPPMNEPDGRTMLCVATLCPRKNQERLILAYRALPSSLQEQHRLLLVGSRGWHDENIVELARSTPGVEWRDYVPDVEYERLLTTCTMFALPSLYEGFGMQILDALQRGIPVLTSDRGSLKEVAGDAAEFVDPERVESITQGLMRLCAENSRQELAAAGPAQAARFTWSGTVEMFLSGLAGL